MTADPLSIRSMFSDAYLSLMRQFPELHEAPHGTEHECLLCERARRAFPYIRAQAREIKEMRRG